MYVEPYVPVASTDRRSILGYPEKGLGALKGVERAPSRSAPEPPLSILLHPHPHPSIYCVLQVLDVNSNQPICNSRLINPPTFGTFFIQVCTI